MRLKSLTAEQFLYGLVCLLGLVLRLWGLGTAPLADHEAQWALQALDVARGQTGALGPQPAYILLTSLLFGLLGSSNFLARLLPALAGGLLPLLPGWVAARLGAATHLRSAALVMAFGLAIDPGLLALSRTAGGAMMAVFFTLLALILLWRGLPLWAGIAAGMALLSGPSLLQGLLGLLAGWGLIRLVESRLYAAASDPDAPVAEVLPRLSLPPLDAQKWRTAAYALLSTLLLVGTLLLRVLQGLGALVGTLPAYLESLIQPAVFATLGTPALTLPYQLLTLLIYHPLPLLLALIALLRGLTALRRGGQRSLRLGLWLLAALIMAVLVPERSSGDLAWVLLPLWALAGLELARYLPVGRDRYTALIAAGLALLIVVMAVVVQFNLLSLARFEISPLLYGAMLAGVLVFGAVAVALVGMGWSGQAARLGAVWGVCAVLCLGMFATGIRLAYLTPNAAAELWSTPPAVRQAGELLDTLNDLSVWTTGHTRELEIVATADSPALRWVLRDFQQARFAASLAIDETPAVVIAPAEVEMPALEQAYRGQDFIWQASPAWQGLLPPDAFSWLALRQAPLTEQSLILWTRADLFPGGTVQPLSAP